MARQYLQISMARPLLFPIAVLHAQLDLPTFAGRTSKKVYASFINYISTLYSKLCLRFVLHRIFEGIVQYCNAYSNLIPLSFVLGFYVSIVMTRWWNQYTSIPWPDSLAVYISANVHGQVIQAAESHLKKYSY